MRIFFDIDGTLLDHKYSERAGVLEFYGNHINVFLNLRQEEFYALWCSISDKHFARFLKGEISFKEQRRARIKEVFKLAGIALPDEEADLAFQEYLREYERNWRLFYDVMPCLESLKKEHTLGIISNGDLEQQLYKLERMHIRDYFDIVVAAGDIGVSKPDRRIFEIACEKSGVSSDQAYYIGDDFKTDIIACQDAGMKGIWLNRNNDVCEAGNITTVFSLETLEPFDFK
jgi:putative hydrolase of the HAD superfamily